MNNAGTAGAGAAAGAAAAAGIPGLNALLLPLLLSFGPSILAKLFGNDPAKELQRKIAALTSAYNVGKTTDQFYGKAIASPAFSQGQSAIAAGANQTANDVAANLAARGIGTTGTGAVLSGLTPSLVGSQVAGLRSAAHTQASQQAMESIKQQLAALTGTYGQASPSAKLFAGGLEGFSPYLSAWIKSRYPGMNFAQGAVAQ